MDSRKIELTVGHGPRHSMASPSGEASLSSNHAKVAMSPQDTDYQELPALVLALGISTASGCPMRAEFTTAPRLLLVTF